MNKLLNITRRLLPVLFLLGSGLASAETIEQRMQWHHEVRIGWGDQLFETLVWHNPATVVSSMPADYTADYGEDYTYYQHLFFEYQYRFNRWFGMGFLADASGVSWDKVTRNGLGNEIDRDPGHYFYNAVVMPTARFTWFRREYVDLYSGIGIGLCVNGGSEVDAYDRHTLVSGAGNVTLLGLSANYDRWCWNFEYGGMYALRDMNTVFLLKSRMFTFSLGVRF